MHSQPRLSGYSKSVWPGGFNADSCIINWRLPERHPTKTILMHQNIRNLKQMLTILMTLKKEHPRIHLVMLVACISNFYRASISEGGLGSRNSVRPSVCPSVHLSICLSHTCIVTKLNDAMRYFYTTRKGNHSATLIPSGWSATPPSLWNLRSKWPTPSKNADFDRFPLITSQP